MRQQQSDTKKQPSRLCKFLLLLVGFKICLLAVVLVEPFVSVSSFLPKFEKTVAKQDASISNESIQIARGSLGVQAEQTSPQFQKVPAGSAMAASPAQPQNNAGAQNENITLDALNRKQEELARQEQDLKALEQELDARFIQMQALEMRLQTMLRDAEETKSDKYKHLVDVLSNMKSRQAAEVLETLDEKIAVRVLAGMRGRQAGEILTYASPSKAARLTESLARMQLPLE